MKLFVWTYVKQLTNRWHPEGGLLVIAGSEIRAREIANAVPDLKLPDELRPDLVVPVQDADEQYIIFPDAGCC